MAKAVSGKIWRFATSDPLRVKSLTLKLDDPQPSYEYELGGGRPTLRWAGIRRTGRLRRPLRCGRAHALRTERRARRLVG